jgi:NADH-ubiquinone oxidoreductase chain 5
LVVTITLAFYEVIFSGSPLSLSLATWWTSAGASLTVEWGLLFDPLTLFMLLPIFSVSMLVQLYSLSYMGGDPSLCRFMRYLSLFTSAMTILVTADNLLVLFLGWESVGIASYLLINFWFTRMAANLAALKAFLLNRIGDLALAWSLILLLSLVADLSTSSLLALASYINGDMLLLVTALVVVAAGAKSALPIMGLHVWLPQAMEGPTPVSALIHAATMVTAGIFLFLRLAPLIEWASTTLLIITWLGSLSAILGALAGLLEHDIKKVIAYSTVSQLGYMAVACGSSLYSLALFHLVNHAFFKALLFLSAGAVIHALGDEQDMRRYGSLNLLLPFTYGFILIGSLSLMAFPFFTGFYSKDLLIELLLAPLNVTSTLASTLLIIGALFTAFYSIRLLAITFIGTPSFPSGGSSLSLHLDGLTFIPLALLSLLAVYFGFIAHELFLHCDALGYETPMAYVREVVMPMPLSLQLLPLIALLPLLSLMPLTPANTQKGTSSLPLAVSTPLRSNILASWNNYNGQAIVTAQTLALLIARYLDRGFIEVAMGPYGLLRLFHYLSFQVELLATGLPHYALLFFITLVLVFSFPLIFSIRSFLLKSIEPSH